MQVPLMAKNQTLNHTEKAFWESWHPTLEVRGGPAEMTGERSTVNGTVQGELCLSKTEFIYFN